MKDQSHLLSTERRNEQTLHIDRATTAEMLRMITEANRRSVEAVAEAEAEIARAVDAVADAFAHGGRLIYIGAGTSGRLAVQDAAECPPTFGVDPGQVIAVIAGGDGAVFRSAENAEDQEEAGRAALLAVNPTGHDVVMGISASGGAAFVASALREAGKIGCVTVSLTCNRETVIGALADIPIVTETGAEVITGSTRMKAGNAQKMVMNMITTCAMVKTGKVYENMMINLRPGNRKLRRRMIGIVQEITDCSAEEAEARLEKSGWVIRDAIR